MRHVQPGRRRQGAFDLRFEVVGSAGRVFDPLQLFDGTAHVFQNHAVAVRCERRHHRRVAQRVDQARYAAGKPEDLGKRVLGEDLAVAGARNFQTVLDVCAHLGLRQCAQVKPQPDALRKLHEFRRVELFVEFGLAGQDDTQHLLFGRLDT